MGEEQKMQLFIGSTPIKLEPIKTTDEILEGYSDYATRNNRTLPVKSESKSWSLTMEAPLLKQEDLKKLFRQPKFPRKLKKAVGQMWDIERKDNECEVSVSVKSKTKWQRKAARMVRCIEGDMCLPMKNGMMFVTNLNKD